MKSNDSFTSGYGGIIDLSGVCSKRNLRQRSIISILGYYLVQTYIPEKDILDRLVIHSQSILILG